MEMVVESRVGVASDGLQGGAWSAVSGGGLPPRRGQAPLLRVGRSLHVLDVENLNGGPAPDYEEVATLWRKIVAPADHDLVVCGSDTSGAFAVREAFRHVRQVVGRGSDGADRALLHVLNESHVTTRFDTVVIGSGDGIFGQRAAELRCRGVYVVVVGPKGGVSSRLRLAAQQVLELAPRAVPSELSIEQVTRQRRANGQQASARMMPSVPRVGRGHLDGSS